MKTTTLKARPSTNRYVLAGVAMVTALTLSRPDLLSKVHADNQYEWAKQADLDPLGGTYTSAAQSANGSHLILGAIHGGEEGEQQESPLYISSNFGAAWENVAAEIDPGVQNQWTSVDVSDNGQVMVAASDWGNNFDNNSGQIGKVFVSRNGGDTWEDITPNNLDNWRKVVVSGDGSKIVAISSNSSTNLYTSEDSGES